MRVWKRPTLFVPVKDWRIMNQDAIRCFLAENKRTSLYGIRNDDDVNDVLQRSDRHSSSICYLGQTELSQYVTSRTPPCLLAEDIPVTESKQ